MKKLLFFAACLSMMQLNLFTVETSNLPANNAISNQWKPKQIYCISEISDQIKTNENDVLVIFDVDEVLITTSDIFIHPECDSIFLKLVLQEFEKAKTPEDKEKLENLLSLSMARPVRHLVEESTPIFIKKVQKQGIKTIALTSCQTGKFGVIPLVEHWRIDQLKALDIDFSSSFDWIGPVRFTEIAKKDKPAPLFEKGILFSKGYSKGEVLEAFLKRLNWKPSKVIFIDDLAENLQSLKQYLDALNIPFAGFQYLKANLPQEKINAALIEFQFRHLIDTGEWLNDETVIEIIQNQAINQ